MLVRIIDRHHRCLKGSSLHDPERQDWPECLCLSCEGVRLLLPDRAADELLSLRQGRVLCACGHPCDDHAPATTEEIEQGECAACECQQFEEPCEMCGCARGANPLCEGCRAHLCRAADDRNVDGY